MTMSAAFDSGRDVDPIWQTPAVKELPQVLSADSLFKFDSPRCGGWYAISSINIHKVRKLEAREKVRLISWLIEQRQLGSKCPEITDETIELVKQRKNASVSDRADAILKYVALKVSRLGQSIIYIDYDKLTEISKNLSFSRLEELDPEQIITYELLAFSESIDYKELIFLLEYMKKREWIELKKEEPIKELWETGVRTWSFRKPFRSDEPRLGWINRTSCRLTIEGHIRLAEIQQPKTDSSQGFIAMWFDPSMDKAWHEAFDPGIREAGYEPMRIDQMEHINKIDDEIIAEIRRSRFVVADLTGGRGGVYYEAGFAQGLSISVIFTCRKDWFEDKDKGVHFDIRQYNFILWEEEKLEELKDNLTNRITAIIGDGPDK